MQCPKCSFLNRADVLFCEECGIRLKRSCPNCGSKIPMKTKFCGYCGHDLRKLKTSSQIDYSKPDSYTPPYLAQKILTARTTIEGERKHVTVLFADVANYTAFASKLDPEEVHQVIDNCFKIMLEEIHRYEGTINQFTGDGVMALFGAPLAHEDHAQRACHAALGIQQKMLQYSREIRAKYNSEFTLRVGMNSGIVLVGFIGDDLQMDYTAMGDTTNLAARMEEMADPGTILVSPGTYKAVRDYFQFEQVGPLEIKGKEKPVTAYKLLGTGKWETRLQVAVAKGLNRFVGREKEIGILRDAFLKTNNRSGHVVGIVGEAGVGKSRLVIEFKRELPTNTTFLEGRCVPYAAGIAYFPILEILREYFGIEEGEPAQIIKDKIRKKTDALDHRLLEVLPALYEVFSLNPKDSSFKNLQPHQKREKIFEAVGYVMIRISEEQPLVLVLDDIQWLDKTSEDFVEYLIDWLGTARILLLLLYRPEYNHQWGQKTYYTQLGLNQLSHHSATELLNEIFPGGVPDPELRDFVISKTGRNPLFLEEFTRTLLENGCIKREQGKYTLNKSVALTDIPDTIQGIISARIDRLQEEIKQTIQTASVIGKNFVFRILQQTTGLRDELRKYLRDLQRLEFIYEKRLFPELEFIFKHALIQEVAYKSLLRKKRRKIHEKIGKAIEEIYPDRLEEFYEMLAYHYSKSDNRGKALLYLTLSGNKAVRNYSQWEGFQFYRQALNVLDETTASLEKDRQQVEIILLMVSPMISLGFPENSLSILQQGEQLSKKIGNKRSLSIIYSTIGLYYSVRGDPVLGVNYTESSYTEALKVNDVTLVAPTGFDLCGNYVRTGEFLRVTEIAPMIMKLIDKTNMKDEEFGKGYNIFSALHAFHGYSLGFLGDFARAKQTFEDGLVVAESMDNPYSLGLLECLRGYVDIIRGDGNAARDHFQNSIENFERAHVVILMGLAWAGLGLSDYYRRNLDRALQNIQKGLDVQKEAGIPYHMSAYYWFLSLVYFDLEEINRAQQAIEKALKLSKKYRERWVEAVSETFHARILLKENKDRKTIEKSIANGFKILGKLRLKPFAAREHLFWGEVYARRKENEKALENVNRAVRMFDEMKMEYWERKARTLLGEIDTSALSRCNRKIGC